MVKHNNVVPNGHFRYNWQKLVKTWFNQPARKVRRRLARDEKKTAFAPRPLKSLRPLVQGQTLKYSAKEKQGRGFTLFEIKQAGAHCRVRKVDRRYSGSQAQEQVS